MAVETPLREDETINVINISGFETEKTAPPEDLIVCPPEGRTYDLGHGRVLVQSELDLKLHVDSHRYFEGRSVGAELAVEIWGPVLKGGELVRLWNEVLPNPGDAVLVKGSTVSRMLAGGWVSEFGVAAKELRADIDIVAEKPISDRLRRSQYVSGETAISAKLNVHGLEVGMVEADRTFELNVEALNELGSAFVQDPNRNADVEHTLIYVMSRLVNSPSVVGIMGFDNFYPWETFGVELIRDDAGEIRAFLSDPLGWLENLRFRGNCSVTRDLGMPYGMVFQDINSHSVHYATMKTLLSLEKPPELESRNIVYTLSTIPRYIVAACEMDLHAVFAEARPPDIFSPGGLLKSLNIEMPPLSESEKLLLSLELNADDWFINLKEVARRMARGPDLFIEKKKHYSSSVGSEVSAKERLTSDIQNAFARGAFSEPNLAFFHTFMHLPLGDFISSGVGDYFVDFHNEGPPPNSVLDEILGIANIYEIPNWKRVLSETSSGYLNPEKFPQVITAYKYTFLCGKLFPSRKIPMRRNDTGEVTGYYPDRVHPKNMSEIMALLFVSMGYKFQENDKEITEVISNWQPKGVLKLSWKIEESSFDTGLDRELISQKMEEYQALLDADPFWSIN